MNDSNNAAAECAEHAAYNAREWIDTATFVYEVVDSELDVEAQAPAQIASAIALADIADQLRRIADRLETADGRPS